jgi:hypothetical protein
MRLGPAVPLAAMIADLLALAGCGGGDDTSTTAGEALSKSEFLAQGNAICEKGDKEINAEAKQTFTQQGAPSQATQTKFVTDTVIPNVQGQIDGIDALPLPSGDEDQVQAIVDAARSGLDKAKADPSLLTDQGGGQSDPFAEANKLANAYGLDKCGSG